MSKIKFERARELLLEIHYLGGITGLLHWDQQVYMPAAAEADRGQQVALLTGIRHSRLIADELFDLLSELKNDSSLSADESLVVRESLEDISRERRKPGILVSAIAKAETDCHGAWLRARAAKDFKLTLPTLNELVTLKIEYAKVLLPECSTYDALVDDFERGARSKEILARFEVLKKGVLEIREGAISDPPYFQIAAPKHRQFEFFSSLAKDIGFDFQRGRVDQTVHPFMSTISDNDHRLTARLRDEDIFYGLFGFLHELGHGLYDQGLNHKWSGTALGEACSLAVHESQSLLWEKQVGFSLEFQEYLLAELRKYFPNETRRVTAEKLFACWNTPTINLVRLESEELGYTLHIILRTELEERVIMGDLKLEDLSAAWAEKTNLYFGRSPKDDLEGVLQDVHWYAGHWGYFPSYLGGAMYAAQLMGTFKSKHSAPLTSADQFKVLLNWLEKNLHSRGKALGAEDLIQGITGSKMSTEPYLSYLKTKVGALPVLD